MARGQEVYQLAFHREMFNSPILSGLAKRFKLTVTVRRAMLSEEGGWAEVLLDGPEEEIGRAVADLQTTGVVTTGPISEPVEQENMPLSTAGVGRGT